MVGGRLRTSRDLNIVMHFPQPPQDDMYPSWGYRPSAAQQIRGKTDMSKPVIFTISATWDDEASVWTGHCDDIPATAGAPTLDELLAKISAMALDLLPDNYPDVDPASLYLQITALREVESAVV
jgi:uncharacterized protein DUF1902